MRLWAVILLVLLTLTSAVAGCGAAGSNDGGSSGASETEAAETEDTDTEATATEEAETEEAPEFDVAVLEASLKKSLSPSSSLSGTGDQPKVQEVDCPEDVEGKAGEKFTCEASGESGLAGSVDVELMNDEGTAYRYKGKLKADGFTTESSGTVTDG